MSNNNQLNESNVHFPSGILIGGRQRLRDSMASQDGDSRGQLSRRTCLGVLGAASVSSFLVSRVGASEYSRVVDMVEAGADNSGDEPIDDVFSEQARDDTLLKFPEGRYRANHLGLYDLRHFAMVGEGATLFPGNDYEQDWIAGMAERDVRIENFTIDSTERGVSPQMDVNAADDLVVRNIHKKGRNDHEGVALGFHTNSESGTALVENVRAIDGGNCVGMYVESEGPVVVRNCHLAGFQDNGLYASTGTGPVRVEGGTFRNNNVAQVRLGSPNSYVRGARIGVDRKVPSDKDTVNMRGVRISDGPGPVTVEDCDIRMTGGEGSGGIVGAFDGGSFDVRNTRIYVGENYTTVGSDGSRTSFGIFVDTWTDGDSGSRSVENVSITGGGTFRSAVLIRRDDNTLRNCCINQSGKGRNGITLEDSTNNTVADTTIDVTDEKIRMRDASARTSNVDSEGTCPRPDDGDGGNGGDDGGDGDDGEETPLPDIPGDIGTFDIDRSGGDAWTTVPLNHTTGRPVVVAGPLSYDGRTPAHARVRDLTAERFESRLGEWPYRNGTHEPERANYLALEAGTYRIDDLAMEVGWATGNEAFRHVEFDQNFDRRPVVFAQPVTDDEPDPVVVRVRHLSRAGVDLLLEEEERARHVGAYRTADIGYVAIEPGTGTLFGQSFEVDSHYRVADDWKQVEFDGTYENPRFLADIQTYDGRDTANLRYRTLDESGVDLVVEKERSDDDETDHRTDSVATFVVEGN